MENKKERKINPAHPRQPLQGSQQASQTESSLSQLPSFAGMPQAAALSSRHALRNW